MNPLIDTLCTFKSMLPVRLPSLIVLRALLIAWLCCASGANVRGALVANVGLATGVVRLMNQGPGPFNLTGYEISSPANDILVGPWRSVSGNLDGSITGDMSFDDDPWTVFSPASPFPPTSDELVEGVTMGSGGVIDENSNLYLGAIWDVNMPRSISVTATSIGSVTIPLDVRYLQPGDFNEDGTVDSLDYQLWKDSFGESGIGLLADGNADGTVNLADYSVWRDHLGATALAGEVTALAPAAIYSVPEPMAWKSIALFAILGLAAKRRCYGVAG